LIFTVAPVVIPEEHRLKMAEFISRANYGLILGNFEIDFLAGELRFKAAYITMIHSLFLKMYFLEIYIPRFI